MWGKLNSATRMRHDNFMTLLRQVVERLFPERQFHLRTGGNVSYFVFSRRLQIALVGAFVLFGAWTAFASISFMLHDKLIVAKDNQIANARLAYRSLLKEVATYQDKFASITNDLKENHDIMLGLVQKNTSLQQGLKSVSNKLASTEKEREMVIATSEYLKGQLSDSKSKIGTLENGNENLKENLNVLENDLQTALAERNKSIFDGTKMRRYIKEMETRLASLQETEMQSVQRLTDGTEAYIDTMQKVVNMTGLKVARLLLADGDQGQGGPFIAAKPDTGLPADKLNVSMSYLSDKLRNSESLQAVMRKMPLSPPLVSYRITSSYGKRRDPVNGKWSAHYGLDMGATLKSRVYATAPGVVTFAGWKGHYGKLIEIDHGAGIKTRYGHLNKILVKKGDKVNFRQNIALLGNTGRSTGPHLHYEITFMKKTRNPSNFIKAGRYVFQN